MSRKPKCVVLPGRLVLPVLLLLKLFRDAASSEKAGEGGGDDVDGEVDDEADGEGDDDAGEDGSAGEDCKREAEEVSVRCLHTRA